MPPRDGTGAASPAQGKVSDAWVVWSYEHDAWWGPGQFGYFEDFLKAGVYSETEAKEIEERANRFCSPSDPNERAYPIRIAMALALLKQPADGVIAPESTVLTALADVLAGIDAEGQ